MDFSVLSNAMGLFLWYTLLEVAVKDRAKFVTEYLPLVGKMPKKIRPNKNVSQKTMYDTSHNNELGFFSFLRWLGSK